MIIIKTKTGVNFINENAVRNVEHNKKHATVEYWDVNKQWSLIEKVESITYTTKETEFKEDGTELEKLKKKYDEAFEYNSQYRAEIFRLQNIIDKIEDFNKTQYEILLVKMTDMLNHAPLEDYKSLQELELYIKKLKSDSVVFIDKVKTDH